jgi:hypothetical protein
MKIILPKVFVELEDPLLWNDTPLFFLVGPIRGGDDWQHKACLRIQSLVPEAIIVVPCRWNSDHPLWSFRMSGREDVFDRQTFWERYYLEIAAWKVRRGCIIAWLPCESKTKPRTDGSPYARDTYGELGEWRAHLMYRPETRFALGAEDDFPGFGVMSRNFDAALKTDFPVSSTLEGTINRAISIALGEIPSYTRS